MKLPPAPINTAVRAKLKADSASVGAVLAAAQCKGNTCDRHEARREFIAAQEHFELGCWLVHYAALPGTFDNRLACARLLMETGVGNPGYDFHTVFGFGERDYDNLFETRGGGDVLATLWAEATDLPNQRLADGLTKAGIPNNGPAANELLRWLGPNVVHLAGATWDVDSARHRGVASTSQFQVAVTVDRTQPMGVIAVRAEKTRPGAATTVSCEVRANDYESLRPKIRAALAARLDVAVAECRAAEHVQSLRATGAPDADLFDVALSALTADARAALNEPEDRADRSDYVRRRALALIADSLPTPLVLDAAIPTLPRTAGVEARMQAVTEAWGYGTGVSHDGSWMWRDQDCTLGSDYPLHSKRAVLFDALLDANMDEWLGVDPGADFLAHCEEYVAITNTQGYPAVRHLYAALHQFRQEYQVVAPQVLGSDTWIQRCMAAMEPGAGDSALSPKPGEWPFCQVNPSVELGDMLPAAHELRELLARCVAEGQADTVSPHVARWAELLDAVVSRAERALENQPGGMTP